MKMTAGHKTQLSAMLHGVPAVGDTDSDYLKAGMTLKRARWDRLWRLQRLPCARPIVDRWFREVYKYCDDRHIDTALRAHYGHKS